MVKYVPVTIIKMMRGGPQMKLFSAFRNWLIVENLPYCSQYQHNSVGTRKKDRNAGICITVPWPILANTNSAITYTSESVQSVRLHPNNAFAAASGEISAEYPFPTGSWAGRPHPAVLLQSAPLLCGIRLPIIIAHPSFSVNPFFERISYFLYFHT